MGDRYQLPPMARALRRICGIQGLCALVQAHRGQQLYVPSPARIDGHPITDLIGRDAAHRLADEFGGAHITVPLCLGALRADRDREIWRRYMDGASAGRLARDYGMTWRGAQKVIQRVKTRGGVSERDAQHAAQLSFGWRQNPIVRPPKAD